MASTSRKKKQELPTEKTNVLSHDEHLKIEKAPMSVENAQLKMSIEEQSLQNMLLELKLLEQKIEKQRVVVNECNNKYSIEKNRYSSIVSDIIKSHNLEGEKFSYNPDTLEILA